MAFPMTIRGPTSRRSLSIASTNGISASRTYEWILSEPTTGDWPLTRSSGFPSRTRTSMAPRFFSALRIDFRKSFAGESFPALIDACAGRSTNESNVAPPYSIVALARGGGGLAGPGFHASSGGAAPGLANSGSSSTGTPLFMFHWLVSTLTLLRTASRSCMSRSFS